MSIAFVREVFDGSCGTSGNNRTFQPTTGTTVGDHLIFVLRSNNSNPATGVTDSKGNAWALDANMVSGTHGLVLASAHLASALTTSDTVTVAYSLNPGGAKAACYEYSGILAGAAADQIATHGNVPGSTSLTTGTTGTTGQAEELLVGAFVLSSSVLITQGSGYTLRNGISGVLVDNVAYEDQRVTVTGTYQAGLTTATTSGNYNAVIVTYFPSSLTFRLTQTSDASVLLTAAKTHTTNAVLIKPATKSHNVTAVIKKTFGGGPSLFSGVPGLMMPGALEPGMPSLLAGALQHSTDAVVKATGLTRTHTVSAVIQKVHITATHTSDAVIRKAATATHTATAVIRKSATSQHGADAQILLTSTKTHSTTALVVRRLAVTHGADAEVEAPVGTIGKDHYTDALVQETFARTHGASAVLRLASTKTHSTDALIRSTASANHDVDAVIVGVLQHRTQALIVGISTATHDADAYIVSRLAQIHGTDTYIVSRYLALHQVDARIQASGDRLVNRFPDAELLVTTILRTVDWGAEVPQIGTKIPARALFGPGIIRVQRLGGTPPERHRLDQARIQVDVWASDQVLAREIADHARQAIMVAEGQSWELAIKPDAWLAGVDDGVSLTYLFDETSQKPRYVFDMILTIHAA